jgi:HSP20 family protein
MLHVSMEVAGLDPESLSVALDGDVLSIAGTRRRRDEDGRRIYQHAEIAWGPFERTVRLPTPVDGKRGVVTYEGGILQLALPLAARPVIARVLLTVRANG